MNPNLLLRTWFVRELKLDRLGIFHRRGYLSPPQQFPSGPETRTEFQVVVPLVSIRIHRRSNLHAILAVCIGMLGRQFDFRVPALLDRHDQRDPGLRLRPR